VFVIALDGARRVLQVDDWVGGEGTKPSTGDYVGTTGLEPLIADGVDIRGPEGASGAGTGDMQATTYDPQAIANDTFARSNHTGAQAISTVTGLQGALDGKLVSGSNISLLTNDSGFTTNTGDITGVTAGTGITGGGSSGGVTVNVDKATAANIRAGASNKVVTADAVEAACEPITVAGGSNWTPNWSSFITAEWNVTANRTVNNATSVKIGTTRIVKIRGSTGTAHTITWGSNYKGNVPTASVSSTAFLLVTLYAASTTEIVVSHVEYAPSAGGASFTMTAEDAEPDASIIGYSSATGFAGSGLGYAVGVASGNLSADGGTVTDLWWGGPINGNHLLFIDGGNQSAASINIDGSDFSLTFVETDSSGRDKYTFGPSSSLFTDGVDYDIVVT